MSYWSAGTPTENGFTGANREVRALSFNACPCMHVEVRVFHKVNLKR
jgi:hypothetical protein